MFAIGAFWKFAFYATGRAVAQSGSAYAGGVGVASSNLAGPTIFFLNEYKTKDWMDWTWRDGITHGL